MFKHHKHDEHSSAKMIAAFVAGVATATVVGGYYLFGPDKKQNRKKAEAWIEKIKDDILEKMEDAEDITKGTYQKIVDEALLKYAKSKKLTDEQVARLKKTFIDNWKQMRDLALESAEEAEDELDEED